MHRDQLNPTDDEMVKLDITVIDERTGKLYDAYLRLHFDPWSHMVIGREVKFKLCQRQRRMVGKAVDLNKLNSLDLSGYKKRFGGGSIQPHARRFEEIERALNNPPNFPE